MPANRPAFEAHPGLFLWRTIVAMQQQGRDNRNAGFPATLFSLFFCSFGYMICNKQLVNKGGAAYRNRINRGNPGKFAQLAAIPWAFRSVLYLYFAKHRHLSSIRTINSKI